MFLEPFRSGSCSGYMSCLACLSDQSCGWCPSVSRCLLRNGPDLELCPERETRDGKGEGQRHLLLAPQHCPLCEEYRDCSACTQVCQRSAKILTTLHGTLLSLLRQSWCKSVPGTDFKFQFDPQDPYCEWQINSSKKGDYQCSRRGRLDGSIRDPTGCPKVCNQWVEPHWSTFSRSWFQRPFLSTRFLPVLLFVGHRRKTCGECLSNSSQCAWCESAQACFYFAAYLTKYPYGECRDWYDR